MTSDWACTRTQNNVTKCQVAEEDDIIAKLTTLTKQVEALAFAKATTVELKGTSIICALYDTMDHSINVCPIVPGVKEACGQINIVNQFLRSGNNPLSNAYTPS